MAETDLARWPDLLVMGLNLAALVAIGWYCSRKTDSADSYFLADRSMPGWIVAFSMMATIISSMTFLALPGATFQDDWRFMPAHAMYFVPALAAYFIFMPFFRRGHITTAYEYLERRFGSWARIYGAIAFLFHHIFRTGIILYAVSLPFEQMSGLKMPVVIVGLGVLVAAYTIAGGLKAVIYTDLLQGIALIIGGLICIPILAGQLPGGLSQIVQEATAAGKFGVGSTAWVLNEKTVWVIILVYQFQFLQIFCTDQSMVQRYLSIRSDDEARRGFILGTALTIPVWLYFAFVGTALYVYYQQHAASLPEGTKPEGVFPYFILTQVPAGVAGFVIAGLLAAAMSTLDSSINASAGTVTNDFYRRFYTNEASPARYLLIGRLSSLVFSAIMICVALTIHFMRTETLMDLQTLVYSVVSAGLLSLFLLGFLTTRVGSRAAATATAATVLLVAGWLVVDHVWRTERELWHGDDPGGGDLASAVSVITLPQPIQADHIKIHFDTNLISGPLRIDAVAVVDVEGATHWATAATASSVYHSPQKTNQLTGNARESEDPDGAREATFAAQNTTGAPDIPGSSEEEATWSSRAPNVLDRLSNGGKQWLRVGYGKRREFAEIHIHQTANPGAITRLTTIPTQADFLPNAFWLGVLPHLFLLLAGMIFSLVWPRNSLKPLTDLTVWTGSNRGHL